MTSFGPFLCVKDRKVWKGFHHCPTCGEEGIKMGTKWRAPKKNNERAWKRVQSGDFLWDHNEVSFPNRERVVARPVEKPRSEIPQWWPGKNKYWYPRRDWQEDLRNEILRRMKG
jgi:hypothetical protein